MIEKILARILIFGTVDFLIALGVLTVNSLSQVTTQRTAPVTKQVVAGKKVWQKRICQDCHTLLGIDGYLAPELTKESQRRYATFPTSWLKDPQAVKQGTTMPNQHLDDQQVANVVAFFQWVNEIDTNNWRPQPVGGAQPTGASPQGALLFQQKGCMAMAALGTLFTFWFVRTSQYKPFTESPIPWPYFIALGFVLFLINIGVTPVHSKRWTPISATLFGGKIGLAGLYMIDMFFNSNLTVGFYY